MTHRYTLTRQTYALGGSGSLCWVMLNPSTADDDIDDPTIRRVVRFTRDRLERGVHPATLRRLADGTDTCGTCSHVHAYRLSSHTYHKCDLHRLGQSRSAASDVRRSWPACTRWEPQP